MAEMFARLDFGSSVRTIPTPRVQFSFIWKIRWPEYNGITSSAPIGKRFITSYNNVSLRWRAVFSLSPIERTKTVFHLYYEDGPIEKFNSMSYKTAIVKSDRSICGQLFRENYEAKRSSSEGWMVSYEKGWPILRQKYGLIETAPLIIRIDLEIPTSVFSFRMQNPLPIKPPQQWMVDLFKIIENQERSVFSNAKIISGDGTVFHCHKIIMGFQSAALEAMFRHPPPDDQPDGEYTFPNLGKDSLKAFLQFLYTSQASIENLSTTEVIQVADAAEQYNLKPLKKACGSFLWDTVKDPATCFEIIRFSDLHADLKYLKNRAMDVLAENFEEMEMFKENVASRFGEDENGKRLREEFQLFVSEWSRINGDTVKDTDMGG